MNIEQIALEVASEMGRDEFIGDALTEFLRRCLAKLAEQAVEPVGYFFQHEDTGQMMSVDVQQVEWGFEKNNPRLINCGKLYTDTQLLAEQQRTAEACAKAVFEQAKYFGYNVHAEAVRDAALNKWREYR